jgi:hypothetical protein
MTTLSDDLHIMNFSDRSLDASLLPDVTRRLYIKDSPSLIELNGDFANIQLLTIRGCPLLMQAREATFPKDIVIRFVDQGADTLTPDSFLVRTLSEKGVTNLYHNDMRIVTDESIDQMLERINQLGH